MESTNDTKQHGMLARMCMIVFMVTAATFAAHVITMPKAYATPQQSDYVNDDSRQLVGLTQDRGRVALTVYWTGDSSQILQLGRIVKGEWAAYTVDVKFDRESYPYIDQKLALLTAGPRQLVSLTTVEAKTGDVVQARAYSAIEWLNNVRSTYVTLDSVPYGQIPQA